MSEKKLYTDKRWTMPLGGEVIGTVKSTPEEREQSKKALNDYIKKCNEIRSKSNGKRRNDDE